ncbi:unnamed protein product [Strongylus vulgaris]|uniref:Uncharacterized protein n=1 Tax=Strongylus vulgaris TaxID=40348 RepID=A0A3P7JI74_STRVU|nr:unnamed protein product [Strongylus vulgaris]
MENGLIPILSHIFTRCGVTPNMYYDEAFTTLLGSLKLLSLSWAVVTLLKEEIDQLPEEVADEKLFEMKIYGVNKERAKNLIRLRSRKTICLPENLYRNLRTMTQPRVDQLIVGYAREGGNPCFEVTLIQSNGVNILVDCGDPWNGEEVLKKLTESGTSKENVRFPC